MGSSFEMWFLHMLCNYFLHDKASGARKIVLQRIRSVGRSTFTKLIVSFAPLLAHLSTMRRASSLFVLMPLGIAVLLSKRFIPIYSFIYCSNYFFKTKNNNYHAFEIFCNNPPAQYFSGKYFAHPVLTMDNLCSYRISTLCRPPQSTGKRQC